MLGSVCIVFLFELIFDFLRESCFYFDFILLFLDLVVLLRDGLVLKLWCSRVLMRGVFIACDFLCALLVG